MSSLNFKMIFDNAAFQDDPGEVARIFREMADKVENGVSDEALI